MPSAVLMTWASMPPMPRITTLIFSPTEILSAKANSHLSYQRRVMLAGQDDPPSRRTVAERFGRCTCCFRGRCVSIRAPFPTPGAPKCNFLVRFRVCSEFTMIAARVVSAFHSKRPLRISAGRTVSDKVKGRLAPARRPFRGLQPSRIRR